MIVTVFATAADSPGDAWKAELLESTWHRAAQPGQLVRLAAGASGDGVPRHRYGEVVTTRSWASHPFTGDRYDGYLLPAALLEWLLSRPLDMTVLLVDPASAFRAALEEEVEPGRIVGTPWTGLKKAGTGPFGLGKQLAYLAHVCVRSDLELRPVTLPLLVHGRDLPGIAARWLELTMLVREECRDWTGREQAADRLALTIAIAERELAVEARRLAVPCQGGGRNASAPILRYDKPIKVAKGGTLWDPASWEPWSAVEPKKAKPGPGRELLTLIEEKIAFDRAGGELAFLLPRRREGVREARILDQMLLEIPGQEDSITLNSSASSIWELVDDARTVTDIASELEREFAMGEGALRGDVERTVETLRDAGALDIVQVAR